MDRIELTEAINNCGLYKVLSDIVKEYLFPHGVQYYQKKGFTTMTTYYYGIKKKHKHVK